MAIKRRSKEDYVLLAVNVICLTIATLLVIVPFWMLIVKSFMSDIDINYHPLALWPTKFYFEGYEKIFTDATFQFGRSFLNSIYITVVGTVYQLVITVCAAYVLSRKDVFGVRVLSGYFIFTMFFGGGTIPYYIQMQELGLVNDIHVMIIPSFISVYNMLVVRSFFVNFPKELEEAALLDGAGTFKVFFLIVLPLSKAIIATVTLFIAVAQWNNWYTALLFIQDLEKQPMAYVLQRIIEMTKGEQANMGGITMNIGKSIQYAGIVVAVLPVMIAYPFFQKHFVKGVMIGSVKG